MVSDKPHLMVDTTSQTGLHHIVLGGFFQVTPVLSDLYAKSVTASG